MTQQVLGSQEISLNGIRYMTVGPVEPIAANVYPAKVVTGDTTRDSDPNLSSVTFSDFRGGMLLDVMEGFQANRCWESELSIRHDRNVTLPPLVSDLTWASGNPTVVTNLAVFNDEVYFWNGTAVRKVTSNTSVSSLLDTMPGSGERGIGTTIGGTEFLVIPHSTGYTHTSDGSSFTDATKDAVAVVEWDSRLWGISQRGQLWYTFTVGSAEVDDANLDLPAFQSVKQLFTGPDALGNDIIYVMSATGLWAHDAANARFVATSLRLPKNADNGGGSNTLTGGCVTWRDAIYVPAGLRIYRYIPHANPAVIQVIGFDVDDGLDVLRGGSIDTLIGAHDALYASVSVSGSGAKNSIYSWNGDAGVGWQAVMTGDTTDIESMIAASTQSEYKMWFQSPSGLRTISFFTLQINSTNPKKILGYEYQDGPLFLKTPWFHANQVDVDKLAVRLKVETADTTANETVIIEYAVDYDEGSSDANYLTLANTTFTDGIIDTTDSGVTVTTFEFPKDTVDVTVAPVGKVFKAIRFKVTENRGSTNTLSPVLISMTLEYRKKLTYKRGYRMILDLNSEYKGASKVDLRATFQTAEQSNTLVEFTFRENDSMYVDVYREAGEQFTGFNQGGRIAIRVLEA